MMRISTGLWSKAQLCELLAIFRQKLEERGRDLPLITVVWMVCLGIYMASLVPLRGIDVLVCAVVITLPLLTFFRFAENSVPCNQAFIAAVFIDCAWITNAHLDSPGIWCLVPALVAVQLGGACSAVFWSGMCLALALVRLRFSLAVDGHVAVGSSQRMLSELAAALGIALTVLIIGASRARKLRRLEREVALFSELAYRDELTGAFSRRYITNYAEKVHHKASRNGTEFSIFLIDIDHFKRINDTFGHATGDQVLQQVVLVLSKCLEHHATIGRFGGEEFLVVIPSDGLVEAVSKAERAREAIEQLRADSLPHTVQLTVSIGVVTFQNQESLLQLIARADSALYMAKSTGRNQVVPSLESFAPAQQELQRESAVEGPLPDREEIERRTFRPLAAQMSRAAGSKNA